jgi:hypothetical protein
MNGREGREEELFQRSAFGLYNPFHVWYGFIDFSFHARDGACDFS